MAAPSRPARDGRRLLHLADDSDLMRLRRGELRWPTQSPDRPGARDRRAGGATPGSVHDAAPDEAGDLPSTRPVWSRAGRSTAPPRPSSGCRHSSCINAGGDLASCPQPTSARRGPDASPGGSASRTRATGRDRRDRTAHPWRRGDLGHRSARRPSLRPANRARHGRSGSVTVVGPSCSGPTSGPPRSSSAMPARLTPSPGRHPTTSPPCSEDAAYCGVDLIKQNCK